jgi:hypothetical protein
MRGVVMAAVIALGLAVGPVVSPGAGPAPAPAVAQESAPGSEPAEPSEPSVETDSIGPRGPGEAAPARQPTEPSEPSQSTPTPSEGAPPKPAAPAVKPSVSGSPAPGPSAPALPTPPGVAAGVFQSRLTGPDVFLPGSCRTGLARADNVGEGYRIIVRGRCVDESGVADFAVQGRGISVGDGDVALDFKVVAGSPRATINLYVRNRDRKLLAAAINPASGQTSLFHVIQGASTTLASRDDVASLAAPTDWNRVALRVSGPEAWLLLNDEPLLYAADVLEEIGGMGIRVLREGSPDDDQETGAVFRDLTLSRVEGGDPARGPTRSAP